MIDCKEGWVENGKFIVKSRLSQLNGNFILNTTAALTVTTQLFGVHQKNW